MKKGLQLFIVFILITPAAYFLLHSSFHPTIIRTLKSLVASNEYKEHEDISGAAAWMEKRLMDPATGKIDYDQVYRVRRMIDERLHDGRSRGLPLNLKWELLGPDNVGGRTRAILIDRNNPNRMYAGSVTGGLFVSDNGGLSWRLHASFNDLLYSQSISSLTQASNGDIYVGTGEIYVYTEANNLGHIGNGIYKSSDNGETFRHIPSTTSLNSTDAWSYVTEVATDPNDPLKIYAATFRGLMVSVDSGFTWSPAQGLPTYTSREVAVNNKGMVFVTIGNLNGRVSREEYYRSEDGNTFDLISGQNGFPSTNCKRIEFAISPDDPDYIYALIVNPASKLRGIYRSTDAGINWAAHSPENSEPFNPMGDQGDYDACIAVVPGNKNKVWVGGQIELQSGGNDVGWRLIATSSPRGATNPYYVHADKHKIVFHPTNPNIAFVGSDGGIFKSENAQNDYPTFTERNKGYTTTQFYSIAASSSGELLAGAQDNGTSYIDFNGNTRFTAELVRGGDGGYTAISKINPNAFFSEIQNGEIYRSSNVGSSWSCWWDKFAQGGSTDCKPSGGSEFIAPFILWEDVANEKAFFLFGGNARVYLTPDPLNFSDSPNFYRVNLPGDLVSTIEKTPQGIFYVGLASGSVYRLDGVPTASYSGNTATGITVTRIADYNTWGSVRYVAGIAADPTDSSHILVTLANYVDGPHVFESHNATTPVPTFSSISGDLPPFPVYSAVIDYYNPNNNFILGTDRGIWATTDGGESWFPEYDGINQVPVFQVIQEMLYDNECKVIYAGTYGRGMFRTTTLLEANRSISCNKVAGTINLSGKVELSLNPNPVAQKAVLDVELSESKDISVRIIDLLGRVVYSENYGKANAGSNHYEIDFSSIATGIYMANIIVDRSLITKQIIVGK